MVSRYSCRQDLLHLFQRMTRVRYFTWFPPFVTEGGHTFRGLTLAYTTQGTLNADGSNVVWIFHALTANSNPQEWWPGLAGSGKVFDPAKDFIVCVNMPGSPYGSTNPLSINPETGIAWYHDFPLFTIRDMINAYKLLRDKLGIKSVKLAIGGSMGGMQALEWAVEEPDFIRNLVLVATNARHTPWGIAFNASQRLAIEADPTWKEQRPDAGSAGLLAARSIALLSYRSAAAYGLSQQNEDDRPDQHRADSYQRYQGIKLVNRFDAFSYHALSRSMDTHHIGRNRGSVEEALLQVNAHTLVIGIRSDMLFLPENQELIAAWIPHAQLALIDSDYGHDGFLLEYQQMDPLIREFLQQPEKRSGKKPTQTNLSL